jgi:hypothetical protein
MNPNDVQEDAVLAALRELRTYDVGPGRAQSLRAQCHNALTMQPTPGHSPPNSEAGVWRRAVRVLAGAWCVLYLVETIRRAAAVYGF